MSEQDGVLLEVEDLRKGFGGLIAVDGISFTLEGGTITGLIGPNGAGKTTTFNLLNGFYRPDAGTIRFKGEDAVDIMRPLPIEKRIWSAASAFAFALLGLAAIRILYGAIPSLLGAGAVLGAGLGVGVYYGQASINRQREGYWPARPYQMARAGMVRTFQITRELQELTVLENLMLAPKNQRGEHLFYALFRRDQIARDEAEIRERAEDILDLLELDHLRDEPAGNLSGGQRKLLELGRVLMLEPDLVLLDEPVAGVNPALADQIMEAIKDMRDEGYGFCVVEHEMDVIRELSDNVIVMSEGKKLAEGHPDQVMQDEAVLEAYIGGDADESGPGG